MGVKEIFKQIDNGEALGRNALIALLELQDEESLAELYEKAYRVKLDHVGNRVRLRGLVELSNICIKDCLYCGIRKSNRNVHRYMMEEGDIVESAGVTWTGGHGSLVLQAGEQQSEAFAAFIERVLRRIKQETRGELGITLSLGEQSRETYQRWFDAGAHRYLLRIETSNRELYSKIHPENHNFDRRITALNDLRRTGYQVGTGVMIGLPWQTAGDLADDILFLKKLDVDMVGMGPYLVHGETPLSEMMPDFEHRKSDQLIMGLKMIALTRIVLKDVNIASTTALQTLAANGRELGLLAGANVIMPNVSHMKYKPDYCLYDNKPGQNETSEESLEALKKSIEAIGESIGFHEWGDSPHFCNRQSAAGRGPFTHQKP